MHLRGSTVLNNLQLLKQWKRGTIKKMSTGKVTASSASRNSAVCTFLLVFSWQSHVVHPFIGCCCCFCLCRTLLSYRMKRKCWPLVVLFAWLPFHEHSSIKCVSGNRIDYSTDYGGRPRLLSFNNDASNIRVELNFAVPFLHIPVGRESLDHSKTHPVVDVNAKSLITVSALLFMLLFVVPRLVRVFIPHASSRISRGIEENEDFNKIVNIMDGVMNKMHIDRAACLQQAICTTVQTASKKVTERKASSWDKIIDGLASNVLFQHYMYGSSAYDAAMYGLMIDRNCSSKYEGCNSGIQKIINIAQTFLSMLE